MEQNNQQSAYQTYLITAVGLAGLIFIALMAGAFLTPSPYQRLKPEPAPPLSAPAGEREQEEAPAASQPEAVAPAWFLAQVEEEGWTVVASGDINRDGPAEVVAYHPSDLSLSESLADPAYQDFDLLVSELMIAQAGVAGEEEGEITDLLKITTEEVTVNGKVVMTLTFPDSEESRIPAAFLMRYPEDDPSALTVIPVNQDGERYMRAIGFAWDTDREQYRIVIAKDVPSLQSDQ